MATADEQAAVMEVVKSALGSDSKLSTVISGVVKFLYEAMNAIFSKIKSTVIETFKRIWKALWNSPLICKMVQEGASGTWNQNESNGPLVQICGCGMKIAGYCLEMLKQCFDNAVHAEGTDITREDKAKIAAVIAENCRNGISIGLMV